MEGVSYMNNLPYMKTKCPHLIKRRVNKNLPVTPVCAYQDLKTWADGLIHESVVERVYNSGEFITYDRHTMLADVLNHPFYPSVQPLIRAGIRIDLGVQVVRLLVSGVMSIWATSCGKIVRIENPNTPEFTYTNINIDTVTWESPILDTFQTLTIHHNICLLKRKFRER
jgi:hypothetical protein